MLLAFLAIPVLVAEFVARKLVADAVAHAVEARIGVSPKIGFGSAPLLLQIVRGRLDTVTVSARGARIGGLPPVAFSATLRDVHLRSLTSLEGAIGSLSVDARLPPSGVRDLLATPACIDSLPASLLPALTHSPRVVLLPGRIDLLPPRGRAAEARLRPYVSGTTLRFALTGLELGGREVSAGALSSARSAVRCSRTLGALPFGVSLTSALAGAGTLQLAFAGRDASFSALG